MLRRLKITRWTATRSIDFPRVSAKAHSTSTNWLKRFFASRCLKIFHLSFSIFLSHFWSIVRREFLRFLRFNLDPSWYPHPNHIRAPYVQKKDPTRDVYFCIAHSQRCASAVNKINYFSASWRFGNKPQSNNGNGSRPWTRISAERNDCLKSVSPFQTILCAMMMAICEHKEAIKCSWMSKIDLHSRLCSADFHHQVHHFHLAASQPLSKRRLMLQHESSWMCWRHQQKRHCL